jgi:ATP-dependent exoDNAse (exonuclease V) alpha subunit
MYNKYIMQQKDALEIMKMGYNVFLTGEAGTGKTHVLLDYIYFLRKKNIPLSICASTGIAATHIDGVTIDSWTGLGIRDEVTQSDLTDLSHKFHLVKRIQKTKVLIIDEISMIAGRRFDAYDRILRSIRKNEAPFGGIQVIVSGDLFQLPPVNKENTNIDFIFNSVVWKILNLKICYLHEVRRQKDIRLLRILTHIRHNTIDTATKNLLISSRDNLAHEQHFITKLYSHNIDVDQINIQELEIISHESHYFYMSEIGPEKLVSAMKRMCLAPEKLELKKDAFVMFVRNNYQKGYVNGTLGKVTGFDHNNDPLVRLLNGSTIHVEPSSWTILEDNKIIAQLTQTPLRLAWAITVHKSQGMTLDRAQIDLSKSFVEGMGYVALSRVRSYDGLQLLGFNDMALRVNPHITNIDKYLIEKSHQTATDLRKMGVLKRWMKKREFIYRLTS